jgi:hypothetical protein
MDSKIFSFFFGVYINPKQQKRYFIVAEFKGTLPENILDLHRYFGNQKEVEDILQQYKLNPYDFINTKIPVPIKSKFKPGKVVLQVDFGQKNHVGILIKQLSNERWILLMFTGFSSGIQWTRNARKATQEELALAGFVSRKDTYLALVTRPESVLEPLEQEFPEYRIEEFLMEFGI